jgi:hypothetical protein
MSGVSIVGAITALGGIVGGGVSAFLVAVSLEVP